jgi:hypothetical protein
MNWSKGTYIVLSLTCVWLLASCGASPSSPDIEVMTPETTSTAEGSALTTMQGLNRRGMGPHARPVVYVTSQGLYYDSIVTADPLPPHGPFQLLEMGPNGLQTEYGLGDRGYVGGRWKEDFDGDGVFHYFLCPLLGPGRETREP